MKLAPHLALLAAVVAASGCGGGRCPGGSALEKYTAQLRGECCQFCTEPPNAQLDDTCKAEIPGGGWLRHPEYECPMWAARCLGEQGPAAAPALIEAARNGPDNFDTGDGVIPVRDAILVSLGKTGNASAVPVLLEALAAKRGSPEAAIEGLKWLGPTARPAVPSILPYLQVSGRVREYTAEALGAIGDPSAVPALVLALDPDDIFMVTRVVDALSKLGSAASPALPALERLVRAQPDHRAHFSIRAAIRAIGGAKAANELPKSYEMMTAEISKLLRTVAARRGVRRPAVHIDGVKEEVSTTLPSGTRVEIRFDKAAWIARRVVTGTVTVHRPQGPATESRFADLARVEKLIDNALAE